MGIAELNAQYIHPFLRDPAAYRYLRHFIRIHSIWILIEEDILLVLPGWLLVFPALWIRLYSPLWGSTRSIQLNNRRVNKDTPHSTIFFHQHLSLGLPNITQPKQSLSPGNQSEKRQSVGSLGTSLLPSLAHTLDRG